MAKTIKSLKTTSGDPDLGFAHRTHRSKKGSKKRPQIQVKILREKKEKLTRKEEKLIGY